jgi:hypothetical protein
MKVAGVTPAPELRPAYKSGPKKDALPAELREDKEFVRIYADLGSIVIIVCERMTGTTSYRGIDCGKNQG